MREDGKTSAEDEVRQISETFLKVAAEIGKLPHDTARRVIFAVSALYDIDLRRVKP